MGDWGDMFAGQERTELGVGGRMLLAADKLLANVRVIQVRNDIEIVEPAMPLEAWELLDGACNAQSSGSCMLFRR
jgi:type III restriction enzyme